MRRISYLVISVIVACGALSASPYRDDSIVNRPRLPGVMRLTARQRHESAPGRGDWKSQEVMVDWEVAKTAIIVCDMWDDIYCKSAKQRIDVMVPKMNQVLTAARNHGVTVIHAPSGTMDLYEGSPYRERMKRAPAAKPKVPIAKWCELDTSREPTLPLDTSKSPCDDPVVGPIVRRFTREHPGLDITGYDGVSDNGEEIFNFCEQQGITNIAIMGVHTNMCVLGRPFGIRQQVRLGRDVVLVRDLTDCMYDPREPPYVSHARGTELVIEHIEQYWCPSISSDDLTRVVAGSAGPMLLRTDLTNP
jgi:nicotinamidase-related amidase